MIEATIIRAIHNIDSTPFTLASGLSRPIEHIPYPHCFRGKWSNRVIFHDYNVVLTTPDENTVREPINLSNQPLFYAIGDPLT